MRLGSWRTWLGMVLVVAGCAHAPAADAERVHARIAQPAGAAARTARADSAAAQAADSAAAPVDSSRAWAFADSVRTRLAVLRKLDGRVEVGGAVSTWNAYFEGRELRYVTEDLAQDEYGTRHNEYFFAREHLRVFTSRGPRSLTGPLAERGPYELRIAFGAQDLSIASEKRVMGKIQGLEDSEATGAQARAAWLYELARQAAAPRKP